MPHSANPSASCGPTVLLVDDNEINLMVGEAMLQQAGACRVLLARDGQEAVDCFDPAVVDLVLMDINMPGIDGLTATRLLRSTPAPRRVPVIAGTACPESVFGPQCAAAGMDGYLSKPFTLEQLRQLLVRWAGDLGLCHRRAPTGHAS